jgi:phosphomannomutase
VLERICVSGRSLAELVDERIARFPCSGEINCRIPDAGGAIEAVRRHHQSNALSMDYIDGLSMEFSTWRLNLRSSNTEPLLRLNVETRGDKDLLTEKTEDTLTFLRNLGAQISDH